FRFHLESVRGLSEHAENVAAIGLASEVSTGLLRDQELAQADALLDEARNAVPFADGSPVNAWDLLATDAYLQRRESARQAAAEAALLQERKIEAQRTLLIEASRRRQALERLKIRRHEAHRAAMERAELARLNEISLLLHDRRLREAR